MLLSRTAVRARPAGSVLASRVRSERRGFATPKDLLMKITSMQGMEKITKSMKLVSAAKLRGDQNRLEAGTAFGKSVDRLLPNPVTAEELEEKVLFESKPVSEGVVILSSDRGLCGGVNSQAAKLSKAVGNMSECETSYLIVGEKARGPMARTHGEQVFTSIDEVWKPPMNFSTASMIADRALSGNNFDEVKVIYNKFKSVVAFSPTAQPVPIFSADPDAASNLPEVLQGYELEPEVPAEVLMNLSEYMLAVKIYYGALENATSEQSSRMNAMENASKNAGEMIEKLQIRYNRARQAKITTELIEIISGAESLKEG